MRWAHLKSVDLLNCAKAGTGRPHVDTLGIQGPSRIEEQRGGIGPLDRGLSKKKKRVRLSRGFPLCHDHGVHRYYLLAGYGVAAQVVSENTPRAYRPGIALLWTLAGVWKTKTPRSATQDRISKSKLFFPAHRACPSKFLRLHFGVRRAGRRGGPGAGWQEVVQILIGFRRLGGKTRSHQIVAPGFGAEGQLEGSPGTKTRGAVKTHYRHGPGPLSIR